MVGVIWLYTMIFTFSALWFTHYGLAVLAACAAPRRRCAPCSPRWRRRPTCNSSRKCRRTSASATRTRRPLDAMNFGALIIGDEILSGRREDKHLARTIAALESRGLRWPGRTTSATSRRASSPRSAPRPPRATPCSRSAASAPRPTTTRASAPRRRWASTLALHPEAAALITQRGTEMAAEKGLAYDLASPDHQRRLNMGVFPAGATLIPNPYNRIPGFSVGHLHFMPGFPVMAHPMLDWLLDTRYADQAGAPRAARRAGARHQRVGADPRVRARRGRVSRACARSACPASTIRRWAPTSRSASRAPIRNRSTWRWPRCAKARRPPGRSKSIRPELVRKTPQQGASNGMHNGGARSALPSWPISPGFEAAASRHRTCFTTSSHTV